jgi:chromosome segregation ATPase
LGAVIARKDTEVQQLRSSLEHQNWGEAESRLTGALQENQSLRTKVEQYESRIVMLSQEIERLNAVIRKTSPSLSPARKSQEQLEGRKLTEYENKLSILNQEIDRLNDSLRARDAKIKDYEQELDRRRQGPQSDNEQTQRLAEAGNRISILTSEVDRLNDVLKRKTTDSESLEQKFRNSSREADDLRRKLVDYEHSMEELSERARGSLQLSVQYEIDGYKRKIAEQEKRISDLDTAAREAENKYRVVEQQSRTYEQQSRGL